MRRMAVWAPWRQALRLPRGAPPFDLTRKPLLLRGKARLVVLGNFACPLPHSFWPLSFWPPSFPGQTKRGAGEIVRVMVGVVMADVVMADVAVAWRAAASASTGAMRAMAPRKAHFSPGGEAARAWAAQARDRRVSDCRSAQRSAAMVSSVLMPPNMGAAQGVVDNKKAKMS